ncbi:MAG: tetratricopeptide repeat-containing sensor histidine kinase [Bacteroidota bacterium]
MPFVLSLLPGPANAQTKPVAEDSLPLILARQKTANKRHADSLQNLLRNAADDTLKVIRLNLLSLYQSFDTATANFEAVIKAKNLAEKLQYPRGKAEAFLQFGLICQNKKDFSTAISYYLKAIDVLEIQQMNPEAYYPPLLNLYFYTGDYPNAMSIVTKGLAKAEKEQDKKKIARYNSLFGFIYFRQGNIGKAEQYYRKYLSIAEKAADSSMLADANNCLGDIYAVTKNYPAAFSSFAKALAIYKNLNHKERIAYSSFKTGNTYKLTGNFEEALAFLLDALSFTRKVPCNNYDIAAYYISAGDVYKELKKYQKAIGMLNAGLVISRDIGHRENTRDAYQYLAETYSHQKKFDSAYHFYTLFTRLKDSIVNEESKRKIAEIQFQYDVEKKDREIARQHIIRNAIIAAFAVLTLMLFFIYNRYRLHQKNKYQQELNRQQNEMFNSIISLQDKERTRIARDIHDSLGSILSATKMKMSALEENTDWPTSVQKEKQQAIMQMLDGAVTELRNISQNLMPATLSKLGLVSALKNLFNDISDYSGLKINFTVHGLENRIDESAEIGIYRIILELINNVVKHAGASEVSVQLIKHPGYININAEDNGRGFDFRKVMAKPGGIGISNIQSRVNFLNGSMDIDTEEGRGTIVMIDIPCS